MDNNKKPPLKRPAFHVDQQLKEASKRAAKAFEQEEKDLVYSLHGTVQK